MDVEPKKKGVELEALEATGAGADQQSKALALLESISKKATQGIPVAGFMSARQLAELYLNNDRYLDNDERIDSLILHESLKNAMQGFMTGFGGFITLPITVPSDIALSWVIQARMVAAIAIIYENDADNEAIWTLIFACMLGEQALRAFSDTTIKTAEKLTIREISKISGETLTKINQALGFRFVTKFGEKGAINLGKLAPLVGGPINGTFDFFFCFSIGLVARRVFGQEDAELNKARFRVKAKEVITKATKIASKTGTRAVARKIEDKKKEKALNELAESLQNAFAIDPDSLVVQQRIEMVLARGSEIRECLIDRAMKSDDAFRDISREILIEVCEPEDYVLTQCLNSKDQAKREFIFSVLEETLKKKLSIPGEEALHNGPKL